jgi:hypothetical protein
MKKIIFCIVAFINFHCSNKKSEKFNIHDTGSHPDTSVHYSQLKASPDSLFPIYLDSIRNYHNNQPIPFFFYNYKLDYEAPWLTDHFARSLRKLLIDSIKNKSLLEKIINSGDSRLDKLVDSNEVDEKMLLSVLPYHMKSNRRLAEIRLAILTDTIFAGTAKTINGNAVLLWDKDEFAAFYIDHLKRWDARQEDREIKVSGKVVSDNQRYIIKNWRLLE